ncbi:MAG: PhoU domain-containing protein, partial [Candidatus Bathyarchaeia archaeon]
MELRRVQETGGTYLISLPKGWAKRVGLSRGSVVAVIEREDGSLVVDPRYQLTREAEVAAVSPSPHMEREITGNYLLGYDIIHIDGRGRLPPNIRERVSGSIHRLIGLEIVEEDASRIVLQCLLDPTSFPPDRILRREHLFASSMLKDVMVAFFENDRQLARGIVERDDEVDRLYFLIVRLLRTAILNPLLSEKMNIRPIDCLDYRLVASFVESIADSTVEIAQSILEHSHIVALSDEVLQPIRRLSDASLGMFGDAMRAVFARDLELAGGVIEQSSLVKELVHGLDGLLTKQPPDVISYASGVSASLDRVCDSS